MSVSGVAMAILLASATGQDFKVSSPAGLDVSYVVLVRVPISLDGGAARPYTALVLAYGSTALPWKARLSADSVVAKLSNGQLRKASHLAICDGWKVSMTPASGQTFQRVTLSTPAAMTIGGKDVSITPKFAVALSSPVEAEFSESGRALWFIFSGDDTAAIDQFVVGDVKLRRAHSK